MTIQEQGTPPVPPSARTSYQPYPQSAHPHSQYASYAPVSQKTAVWALVLALVPIPVGWLVSIGLAISVLSASSDGRGRERGKGMAIAALVIASLWVVAFVGLMVLGASSETHRDASHQVTSAGDSTVFALRTGDCIADLPEKSSLSRTVPLVPCSQPHAAQVFASFELAPGTYPGGTQVRRLAEGGCVRRFEETFAKAPNHDQLRMFYFYPTSSSWSSGRLVSCVASTPQAEA